MPESGFLGLDLLSKLPAELFFFLLKLGIFESLDFRFTKLARLHLLLPIVFIVEFLRR